MKIDGPCLSPNDALVIYAPSVARPTCIRPHLRWHTYQSVSQAEAIHGTTKTDPTPLPNNLNIPENSYRRRLANKNNPGQTIDHYHHPPPTFGWNEPWLVYSQSLGSLCSHGGSIVHHCCGILQTSLLDSVVACHIVVAWGHEEGGWYVRNQFTISVSQWVPFIAQGSDWRWKMNFIF